MAIKLDIKDRKLLYQLDFEARQSLPQLARKVSLSPEAVHYRLKKLERSVIKSYVPMINFGALGLLWHKLFLKFGEFSQETEMEIVGWLKKQPEVTWIASCNGSWDMMVSILTPGLPAFFEVKDRILTYLSEHLLESSISCLEEGIAFHRAYLAKGPRKGWLTKIQPGPGLSLDELDWKILKTLSENGRMPLTNIAARLQSEPKTIAYRLNRLKKRKILLGCRITLNYEQMGYHYFKCLIKLNSLKKEEINKLISFCRFHPNCLHFMKASGNWDLEPEFELRSNEELFSLVREMRNLFPKTIKSIDTLMIAKEYKFTYF